MGTARSRGDDSGSIEFERTDTPFGVYIEGVEVQDDGTREVLRSATIGSPRDFDRIRQFKQFCQKQCNGRQ